MRKILAIACLVFCAFASHCRAEGLNALIEVSKSMGEANKELAAETASYKLVKSAVDSGVIAKGQSRGSIRSKYGEPVVINEDFITKRERWVYKSADSSFFKGARICLLFDNNGALDEINVLQ